MSDEELVEQYAKENPHCLPDNNPTLKAAVSDIHYVDRGMWGPYGGKGGTISKPWIEEYRQMVLGEGGG